ncbi:8491_t:CDS:2 [Diversispora eburnea]|uniref:8491_t:CDS:1 n=1 Tax=Diversispora eburnea TaxID=1213867 RepID=A0A9N8WBX3_9GLOM|nr:8491_t:CDS:2 [Diversispora eburnea]
MVQISRKFLKFLKPNQKLKLTSPSGNYNRSSSPQSSVKIDITFIEPINRRQYISRELVQSSDNPIVIDVDAEESRPPEVMSSFISSIPVTQSTQSTQPNQPLNLTKHTTTSTGLVELNQFRQSSSLPQVYYSSNTLPPPPPHHSVQLQGPNNMTPSNPII